MSGLQIGTIARTWCAKVVHIGSYTMGQLDGPSWYSALEPYILLLVCAMYSYVSADVAGVSPIFTSYK